MRVLLTIGLLAPASFLYVELRHYIDGKRDASSRELLGVDYLRAIAPLRDALGAAQSTAVAGGTAAQQAAAATLATAVQDLTAVDDRIGAELGTTGRWRDVRTRLETLRGPADPRVVYATYHDVMDLVAALTDRVGQLSGLAVDPATDTYFLHRAVTTDLPELTVAIGRFADLIQLSRGSTPRAADLADMLELQRSASDAAARLVNSMETATEGTTSTNLVPNVYAQLDAFRADLDQLVGAGAAIADGEVSAFDSDVVSTLRTNLTKAAAVLSTTVLDQIVLLVTERRDDADSERTIAVVLLAIIALLALVPVGAGVRDVFQRQRENRARDEFDAAGPDWVARGTSPAAGRERAVAAR